RESNRRARSQYYDQSRNQEPKIIVEAMKLLSTNQVPFFPGAIEDHLQDLKRESDEVARLHGKDSDEYKSAWGKYVSDRQRYQAVLNQQPEVEGSHWVFYPAYAVEKTGRIHHIQGGLQSASRAMKAAAYTGVDGLRNYDLENSQSRLVIQYLEEAGLDPAPPADYHGHGEEAR